ncbi:acylase [Pseudomonas alkylphenolica]|uniref:Acylase n=1 Tax=Pseudomonas alkylphenolica TaxID=237609 RepID=A0A443ZPK0_9PSED|nr:acylase [Pseudomonas alkylphenolica]RWU21025.1 acylase [Pseudomonas alkylphenolica]
MIKSRPLASVCLAGLLVGLSGSAQARVAPGDASAEIRRTSFGVPHILARDEQGLGYGIGYAYGQDNLCLLANEVVTVNAERSRYFGPDQLTLEQRKNIASDLFFSWLNTPSDVFGFWQAQPEEVRALLEGYAKGFNRALAERTAQGQGAQCLQAQWLRPITALDLVKLTRRLLVEGGVGQFADALAAAAPPSAVATLEFDRGVAQAQQDSFSLERGSNAVAIGRDRSASGRGMLLANPHFPWAGGMRFYQMQLTLPGKLDVMGAALPGLPLINIGFNRHLAWTHTVDTSRHFTLYRLELDPKDPTRYLLDGKSVPLTRQQLTVKAKGEDGTLKTVTRDVYSSVFGPVVQWPGRLDWDGQHAFSLRDANLGNTRVLQQWYTMNRADSLKALQDSVQRLQGIPWVNTLAVDEQGQTLYLNQSVVPYVDAAMLAHCSDPAAGQEMVVLDGSRTACNWKVDSRAAQPGIFPTQLQPSLRRKDFVQHSNDSAWMVNPAQPLRGYSPLISREDQPLGVRSRFALQRLAGGDKLTGADLQQMVMGNQVYLAELLMPDVLQWCGVQAQDASLAGLCSSLKAWNLRADLDSGIGWVHFQNILQSLLKRSDIWRVAFDPADPQHTPRGLAIERAEVAAALNQAAQASLVAVKQAGLADDVRWGQIQQASDGTPIHGGPASLGVYNAIQSVPGGAGKRQVVSGTSYLQVVTFDANGPQARGLLAFSESSEAQSPHGGDQTRAFSAKQWHLMPFTEAQIKADPQYRVQLIRETASVADAAR